MKLFKVWGIYSSCDEFEVLKVAKDKKNLERSVWGNEDYSDCLEIVISEIDEIDGYKINLKKATKMGVQEAICGNCAYFPTNRAYDVAVCDSGRKTCYNSRCGEFTMVANVDRGVPPKPISPPLKRVDMNEPNSSK